MNKGIMVQGTGSSVGKSLLTAAFCRLFANRGMRVAPFKSQNMALNSFVTADGGEMGIAQALQAEAAYTEPRVDMNPVLLKPISGTGSQVIIQGRVHANKMVVREYHAFKDEAWRYVVESFERLAGDYDCLVAEGAGSPVEVNLSQYDICNMRVAELGGFPVILVADIDKGGVFAQIVGTLELMTQQERERVAGVIINKFRGDRSLLDDGISFIEAKTGKPVLGVVPYIDGLNLEDEDGTALERDKIARPGRVSGKNNKPVIGIIRLPHISNFSDFTPLNEEAEVVYIFDKEGISRELDCIIIPGSKNTIGDLGYIITNGIAGRIVEEYNRGRLFVMGICGGFQMLGRLVSDPCHTEGDTDMQKGLCLLDLETTLEREKITRQVGFSSASGECFAIDGDGEMRGFEIHTGRTVSTGVEYAPLFKLHGNPGGFEGVVSGDGRVVGTYIHGLFANDNFRHAFLGRISPVRPAEAGGSFHNRKQAALDRLARVVEKNIDMERILGLL